MTDTPDRPQAKRFSFRDVPGTTIAVAALAVLGTAAIVSAPLWVWYWRKRKRADALASHPPGGEAVPSGDAAPDESPQAPDPLDPARRE